MIECKKFKKGKLSVLLVILSIFISFIPSFCFAAPKSAEIGMEVKGGYADTAMIGSYTPFNVTLFNNGEAVDGELQILVNTNQESRAMYAMPVSLPKGSSKLLKLEVPTQTVNRKIEVRFASGRKIIKTLEYQLKKIIPPESPVIGILSDDPDTFANLNGIKIIENVNPGMAAEIRMKYSSSVVRSAAGFSTKDSLVLPERPVELIYLDANNMPDNTKALNAFNMIIISNFDTSSLKDKQVAALDSWIKSGKNLFVGTGSNWRKVYSGLTNELKPYSIETTTAITTSKALEDTTGIKEPLSNLSIATGNPGNGNIILKDSSYPLAVTYKNGLGTISVLTFDPTLKPVSGWIGEQTLWKEIINKAISLSDSYQNYEQGRYSSVIPSIQNMQHLASVVPETQTPPFLTLLIIIALYILIAGPTLYLVLKWKDKRDWNWVIIPITAFVFMGVIYVSGFKTRFTTAVLNNISIISLDNESHTANVNTIMGAFNNSRGSMKIKYDNSLNLDMDINNQYYYNYGYNPNQGEMGKKVLSKQTFDSMNTYELYEVTMWQPRFFTAHRNERIKDKVIDYVSIVDGKISARIKNTTRFAFKDSFIAFGNNFISIGNLLPGEEKTINSSFTKESTQKNLSNFLDSIYDQKYNYSNNQVKRPEDWRERSRKREMLSSFLQNSYLNSMDYSRLMFCAFNTDDPGFSFNINDKKPKSYNMNIIYSTFNNAFKKGQSVEIPSGIIKPVAVQPSGNNITYDYFSDGINEGIRVFADGDIEFLAKLPDSINVSGFKAEFSNFLPSYIKYQQLPKGATKPTYAQNTYKYYIYNNSTANWDETAKVLQVKSNKSPYVNDNGEIKLKVNAIIGKNGQQEEILGLPDIEVSGVVK